MSERPEPITFEEPADRVYKTSDRGFTYGEPIPGYHANESVQVYESSLATEPTLWVNVKGVELEEFPGEMSVLMTMAGAKKMRDDLTHIIDNHYQNRTTG